MRWVVATRNRDKVLEIRDPFNDLPVELVSLTDFPAAAPVEETGTSLQENALLKASAAFQETGLPALADDTGLEVDALDGAPGIFAARFAGSEATYGQNRDKLLEVLAAVADHLRAARFRTCAVYLDDTHQLVAEGVVEGRITRAPHGEGGFGYDPIFRANGSEKTFGQMTSRQKQRFSHRGRAFRSLLAKLNQSLDLTQNKEITA